MLTLVKAKERTTYSSYHLQKETTGRQDYLRPLTTEEISRVNYATVREGVHHCLWPTEVIERFLAAEV